MTRKRREAPDECGQCGEAIPPRALACPGCGADEETGWDANPWLNEASIELPEDEDEDELLDRTGVRWSRRRRILFGIVVMIVLGYAYYLLAGLRG